MNINTFSIVARSADGTQLGVAVASKFLAVGAYVPAASLHGAIATQAHTNLKLHPEGLRMLKEGTEPSEILETFFASDTDRDLRQAGIVDSKGNAATFTGSKCDGWAGGIAGSHLSGSFAIQGNLLAGPEVIEAIKDSWCNDNSEHSLARTLVTALEAGELAGGDKRGKQAAAVYVVGENQGYGGTSDTAVDLRCDDSENPIAELYRLLKMHEKPV